MVPEYLCEQVSIRKSSWKLGSSSQVLLQVPVFQLKAYGDCKKCIVSWTFFICSKNTPVQGCFQR